MRTVSTRCGSSSTTSTRMGACWRGMSDDKLRREIQALGCSANESERLLKLNARETAALAG